MEELSKGDLEPGDEDSNNLDVVPLTEAHLSQQNVEIELESFRQRWKDELSKNLNETGNGTQESQSFTQQSYTKDSKRFISKDKSCGISSQPKQSKQCSAFAENATIANSVPSSANNDSFSVNISNDAIRLGAFIEEEKEQKARSLYVRGVELERAGKLYEAIQEYRRAMQLVPHIESIAVSQGSGDGESAESCSNTASEDDEGSTGADEEVGVRGHIVSHISALLGPNAPVCQKRHQQQSTHLSRLPLEIMEQIMCWVVGGELDMRSLHAVAAVCRGFFLLSRSETLWKKACQRVWGPDCAPCGSDDDTAVDALANYSWRDMYLKRPKPRYNGCYISKISYFRSGECNFHDQNYQPWHLVVYYRFFRFFPGDVVLMTTTSDQPQAVVALLAHKDPKQSQVLAGRYTLEGSLVHLHFRRYSNSKRPLQRTRRRRGQGTTDVAETHFNMTLELCNARQGGRNWFLQWRSYSISSVQFSGVIQSADVDVTQLDSFPQLAFSRVKSYTREAMEPLK
ncbi:F-box only protein 9 isoform X2 [Hyalella azteca]|uniref:F-box only protein 9 isoform X1 n=1 Tax=Hyalella azteca TaxID=294128 RepID=A0A8B7NIT8_HYAAZ|nr:F-box only protein 9 isoform X1 [Hyalella azteca]XP_018013550.1 F-box only protein 9 isoform X1 [Hyalella azteca]XP_018013551.1 F-box only protein 9 isoform X2 [Hyalella azteca]